MSQRSIEKRSVSNDGSISNSLALSYTKEEESALVRKLDLTIVPILTLLYLCNFIDRTNIGNARILGLEKDIRLKGFQYNIGLSIFYIVYSLIEVPSNLLLRKVGANWWIPLLVVGFGAVCLSTAFITDFAGFMVVRVFLGVFEGGMMPGITYYMSTYYKKDELVVRVVVFVTASALAGAFGGLLATAIMEGVPQLAGVPRGLWRNIFFVEGLVTIGFGLIGLFIVQGSISKNRFLTERQKQIAEERLIRDGQSDLKTKGNAHGSWKLALTNVNVLVCGFAAMLINVSVQGTALFMPTILRGMGYSPKMSQLMSVPPYVVSAFWSLVLATIAFKTKRRGLTVLSQVPIAISGMVMLVASTKPKVNYGGIFLIAMSVFPMGPILLAWGTSNAAPDKARAAAPAVITGIGTLGPILTSWIYLPTDGPRYVKGNSVQIGCQGLVFILITFLVIYNNRENRKKAQANRSRLDFGPEGRGTELGHRHPDFVLSL